MNYEDWAATQLLTAYLSLGLWELTSTELPSVKERCWGRQPQGGFTYNRANVSDCTLTLSGVYHDQGRRRRGGRSVGPVGPRVLSKTQER